MTGKIMSPTTPVNVSVGSQHAEETSHKTATEKGTAPFWWNTISFSVSTSRLAVDYRCCFHLPTYRTAFRMYYMKRRKHFYCHSFLSCRQLYLLPQSLIISSGLPAAGVKARFQLGACLSIIKSYLFYFIHPSASVYVIEIGSFRFIITHLLQF